MARLPFESANWISYAAALQDAINRFGSTPLAIAKLDAVFAAHAIRCKIERIDTPPELVPRSARIAVTVGAAAVKEPADGWQDAVVVDTEQLLAGWQERLGISLNGQPQQGWLFVWNLDLIKYFCLPAGRLPKAPVRGQEIPENQGRPTKHKWEAIRAEIVRRYWKNGRLIAPESEQGFAEELQKWALHKLGKEPALSDMRTLVKHTIATLKLISQ